MIWLALLGILGAAALLVMWCALLNNVIYPPQRDHAP
jgi:uncharacterized protein YhhL (DUF1145 family)